ncbi:MAG TPA: F0F1 ATP synthase subunit delta [Acetobacteraceae bacterium]|nr:F0F1 ATP synthase subunit delta [Acetobacteraceae bacterium]
MRIDLWTLGLQAINALVLVWLLARFLFRPLTAIVAQRRQATETLLADAAAARAQAQVAADSIVQQRQAVEAEADQLRATAHQDAEADRAAQLAQARAEIALARQDAEAALARERAQQQKQMEAHTCTLAVDIARRLVARVASPAITSALAQGLAQDIAALPLVERQLLAADAGHLQLVSAVALDASARADIAARLTHALGVAPQLEVRVDPALLGGIELVGPHTLIRNSWRADLERLAGALAAETADAA